MIECLKTNIKKGLYNLIIVAYEYTTRKSRRKEGRKEVSKEVRKEGRK
jgi:hypothetical protein